jgi:hypothetical protein
MDKEVPDPNSDPYSLTAGSSQVIGYLAPVFAVGKYRFLLVTGLLAG